MTEILAAAVVTGLLGLIAGSFIAAVSVRLPREEDVVMGRSRCMSCGRPIAPWHLIPVVSWLLLRARCARCGARVSPRYPLIELAAGIIGVWAALHSSDTLTIGIIAILGWQLLLIAIIDGENYWLPDILTWPLVVTGLIAGVLIMPAVPWNLIIGAVAGFASLWLFAAAYKALRARDGLGGGDPFLFAGAGAWVGWMGLPSVLMWACAAGLSVVLALLIMRRKVEGTDRLPFGVFLAIGVWLTWLYGPIGL